jgi:hypothetical protein
MPLNAPLVYAANTFAFFNSPTVAKALDAITKLSQPIS